MEEQKSIEIFLTKRGLLEVENVDCLALDYIQRGVYEAISAAYPDALVSVTVDYEGHRFYALIDGENDEDIMRHAVSHALDRVIGDGDWIPKSREALEQAFREIAERMIDAVDDEIAGVTDAAAFVDSRLSDEGVNHDVTYDICAARRESASEEYTSESAMQFVRDHAVAYLAQKLRKRHERPRVSALISAAAPGKADGCRGPHLPLPRRRSAGPPGSRWPG